MWKLNSCFDARPEYGPIGAVSTLAVIADPGKHLRDGLARSSRR
jgi:hypothetical protein